MLEAEERTQTFVQLLKRVGKQDGETQQKIDCMNIVEKSILIVGNLKEKYKDIRLKREVRREDNNSVGREKREMKQKGKKRSTK